MKYIIAGLTIAGVAYFLVKTVWSILDDIDRYSNDKDNDGKDN